MVKQYKFKYGDFNNEVIFKVDTNVFTKQVAQEQLDFYCWYKYECPISEILKRWALEILKWSYSQSKDTILNEFKTGEGKLALDGSYGIELIEYDELQIDHNDISLQITDTAV